MDFMGRSCRQVYDSVGGTFIEGATFGTPNEEEFGILLENGRKFYGLKE